MQTATLKKAAEELGVSLEDIVFYHKQGNKALIQIDINTLLSHGADHSKPDETQDAVTSEEEFRRKYPHIKIRPELFKLVGCMADVSLNGTDKDLLIAAVEGKYGI
jgi:hypothetical protein